MAPSILDHPVDFHRENKAVAMCVTASLAGCCFCMVLSAISLLGTEDVVILLWFADWMGTRSTY